jgi:hypothetical protein
MVSLAASLPLKSCWLHECGARRALIMEVWSAGSLSGDGEWFGEVPRA